jgi:hypothetical protein
MPLVNGNMDENYYKHIIKSIGYVYEDLFSSADIDMIQENTFFEEGDDDEIDDLVSIGLKENDPSANLKTTMFRRLDDNVYHAFSNIYAKLICCLGDKNMKDGKVQKEMQLEIPVYDPADGTVKLVKRGFSVDDAVAKCVMDDGNFYDDGTKDGFSPDCQYLMNKYCLFLQKYDPESPLIDKLCGCVLANKYIHPVFKDANNVQALISVKAAKNCGIEQCQNSKWRGLKDRESCAQNIAICTNNVTMEDIEAGGDVNMDGITMNNDCGGSTSANIPANNADVPEEIQSAVSSTNNREDTATDSTDSTAADSTADSTAADSTAADSTSADSTAEDSTAEDDAEDEAAEDEAADTEEELGFFAKIMAWFSSLFGGSSEEGFSPKNNKFDQIYSVFSIIVVYMLIFKDPFKIQKKIQKMF